MRNISWMAALGAALIASCGGGNTMPPPVDCGTSGAIPAGCSELRLSSTPGGAAATLDGMAIGSTPVDTTDYLDWRGPAGFYTVELTLEGYEPFMVDLTLPDGRPFDYGTPLTPIASGTGMLDVSADVIGGTLVIDGADRGTMDTMPMAIELSSGIHTVTVRIGGYVSATPEVSIRGGERASITVAVGRDLTGTWMCTTGTRSVTMDPVGSPNTVYAVNLDAFVYLIVSGDRLSSMEGGTLTGTVSTDVRSIDYTFMGTAGSYSEHCTR